MLISQSFLDHMTAPFSCLSMYFSSSFRNLAKYKKKKTFLAWSKIRYIN